MVRRCGNGQARRGCRPGGWRRAAFANIGRASAVLFCFAFFSPAASAQDDAEESARPVLPPGKIWMPALPPRPDPKARRTVFDPRTMVVGSGPFLKPVVPLSLATPRDETFYIHPLDRFVFMDHFHEFGSLNPNAIGSRYAFVSARPQHLLGADVPGRKWLLDHGLSLDLSYKSETLGNPWGGKSQGAGYAQEVALKLDVDWNRLAGVPNITSHLLIVQRAGRNFSSDRLGDPRVQLQEVYGAGGNVLAHLVWAYGETRFFNRSVGVDFGRIPVALEVAHSALYCQFTTLCSAPNGLKKGTNFDVWPRANWGVSFRLRPLMDNILTLGAFEANPRDGGRSGWSWFNGGSTGVLLPVEDVWQPYIGPHALVGHYKIGYSIDTSRYRPLGLGAHGAGKVRDSVWVLADQMLWRTGRTDTSGVIVFGGYTHNTGSNSVFRDQAFGAVDAGGVIPGRPEDRPGIAFAHYDFSRNLVHQADVLSARGLPVGGLPELSEGTLEVKYGAMIVPGLRVTPTYYYVIHPAASRKIDNASVFGLTLAAQL